MQLQALLPKLVLAAILMSASALTSGIDRSDPSLTLGQVMASMNRDPSGEGMFHVGDDGVLRTLTANNTVVDYRQLTPDQIAQSTVRYSGAAKEHLNDVFEGVDGRDVTDPEKLWTLSPELIPAEVPTLASGMSPAQDVDLAGRIFKRQCNTVDCATGATCSRFGCGACLRPDVSTTGICEDT